MTSNFELKQEDCITTINQGKTLRYVFENPSFPFNTQEQSAISQIRNMLDKKVNTLSSDDSLLSQTKRQKFSHAKDAEILRFYYGVDCNLEKALSSFEQAVEEIIAKDNTSEDNENTMTEIFSKVPFYTYGKDSKHRPIQIINLKVVKDLLTTGYTETTIKNAYVFFLQELMKKCLHTGFVENWVSIFDFEGLNDISVEEVKQLTEIFHINPLYNTMEYRSYWFNIEPNMRMFFGNSEY